MSERQFMCGRYNFTVEQSEEIYEILEKLNAKLHGKQVKTGEVFPTEQVPILVAEKEEVTPQISSWGFPKFDQKGVIINARSETAFEKRTFRESLLNRRCVIPSTGFYEWDARKQKFLFRLEGTGALYMAGLYTVVREEIRFVILTTQANESMQEVHTRMPLVLKKAEVEDWILDQRVTNEILHQIPPMLVREIM